MVKKISSIKDIVPVIILNWNGEQDTIECLKSIKISNNNQFLPVVIDNGSKIESLMMLKKNCSLLFSNIYYIKKDQIDNSHSSIVESIINSQLEDTLVFIENSENLGFAKGNNVGVKIAEILGSEWIMLLNNDTEIEKNSFTNLVRFINEHPDIYAITPEIRFYHEKERIWNCGGDLTYFGSRKYLFANQVTVDRPTKGYSMITFITGCALLFNFKKTGILTENFFFGEEDYEFSLRLKKKGLKMACVHQSIIYHKVGSSIKKNSNGIGQIYLYYINRLINTKVYYTKLRWNLTKALAYFYLPVLLYKNDISVLKSFRLLSLINYYIKNNTKVDYLEFQKAIKIC